MKEPALSPIAYRLVLLDRYADSLREQRWLEPHVKERIAAATGAPLHQLERLVEKSEERAAAFTRKK